MRLRLPRGKLQKCQRVRFTPVPAEIAERQGVAGQLQIPVGQQDHPPADRVPPVHAQTQGKQELPQAVPAADMRKFMGQDHPQRLPVGQQVCREQDDRPPDTIGQRRTAVRCAANDRRTPEAEGFHAAVDRFVPDRSRTGEPAREPEPADKKIRAQ